MTPLKTWKPKTTRTTLKSRAYILEMIRDFFKQRGVLEVETPILSNATVTDVNLHSFSTNYGAKTFYLQTSPEFAMKRLLACGMDSIFQITKAFRAEEFGRLHNAEFTMLEWYRIKFDMHALMNEVNDLLHAILGGYKAIEKISYKDAFLDFLHINPHIAPLAELQKLVNANDLGKIVGVDYNDRDILLQLLMSQCIEPNLRGTRYRPMFIYDYPASQAALARLRRCDDGSTVAERFEVYINGIELANGFHELCDADEQEIRFKADLKKRQKTGRPIVPIDYNFISALKHGLPDCSGVALGLDRLIMLALGKRSIQDVITFPIDRA